MPSSTPWLFVEPSILTGKVERTSKIRSRVLLDACKY
jgi:hypothetical protein